MAEEYLFRRRNRLKKHFLITSNVLLYGYHHLSDGAKITYQVTDSFDWEDGSKTSKGYAFPSVGTIARIRGVSERTIQRHLKELVSARLLTRQERPGDTTLLIIEDVSEEEAQTYLRQYVEGGDKNVTPPPTNLSPKIEEKKENEISVNENRKTSRQLRRALETGNSKLTQAKSLRFGSNTRLKDETWARREYYAQEMLKVLGDGHSLGCYRAIAERCPPSVIFEALSIVKEVAREGKIRQSRGALFVDLVKRLTKTAVPSSSLVKEELCGGSLGQGGEPATSDGLAGDGRLESAISIS